MKTFTSQLKIFHTRNELLELDQVVNGFIASGGIRKVISVSDSITSGEKGEAIGIIRVITYEESGEKSKEKVLVKMEKKLKVWSSEIEKFRGKTDKIGTKARGKIQNQAEDLRAKQELARQKLQEMKKAGGEAWEDLRAGAEVAMDDLRKAVEKVIKKREK
ncbi:MAG: hypothetical protein HKM86_12485 [Deltaproteobacteria bacterium]|nr:hypothetical protein [Deltaproteobacteria bacterium]